MKLLGNSKYMKGKGGRFWLHQRKYWYCSWSEFC